MPTCAKWVLTVLFAFALPCYPPPLPHWSKSILWPSLSWYKLYSVRFFGRIGQLSVIQGEGIPAYGLDQLRCCRWFFSRIHYKGVSLGKKPERWKFQPEAQSSHLYIQELECTSRLSWRCLNGWRSGFYVKQSHQRRSNSRSMVQITSIIWLYGFSLNQPNSHVKFTTAKRGRTVYRWVMVWNDRRPRMNANLYDVIRPDTLSCRRLLLLNHLIHYSASSFVLRSKHGLNAVMQWFWFPFSAPPSFPPPSATPSSALIQTRPSNATTSMTEESSPDEPRVVKITMGSCTFIHHKWGPCGCTTGSIITPGYHNGNCKTCGHDMQVHRNYVKSISISQRVLGSLEDHSGHHCLLVLSTNLYIPISVQVLKRSRNSLRC